jgi:hypothetical protein
MREMPVMTNLDGIQAKLNNYAHIRTKFDELINLINNMNTLTSERLAANDFSALISAVEAAQA